MQNIRSDIMHHVELFVCIYLFTLSRISSVTSDVGRRRYSDLQPEESNHPIEFIKSLFPSCYRGTTFKSRIGGHMRGYFQFKTSENPSLMEMLDEHMKEKKSGSGVDELFLDVDPDYFKVIWNGLKLVFIYFKYS